MVYGNSSDGNGGGVGCVGVGGGIDGGVSGVGGGGEGELMRYGASSNCSDGDVVV